MLRTDKPSYWDGLLSPVTKICLAVSKLGTEKNGNAEEECDLGHDQETSTLKSADAAKGKTIRLKEGLGKESAVNCDYFRSKKTSKQRKKLRGKSDSAMKYSVVSASETKNPREGKLTELKRRKVLEWKRSGWHVLDREASKQLFVSDNGHYKRRNSATEDFHPPCARDMPRTKSVQSKDPCETSQNNNETLAARHTDVRIRDIPPDNQAILNTFQTAAIESVNKTTRNSQGKKQVKCNVLFGHRNRMVEASMGKCLPQVKKNRRAQNIQHLRMLNQAASYRRISLEKTIIERSTSLEPMSWSTFERKKSSFSKPFAEEAGVPYEQEAIRFKGVEDENEARAEIIARAPHVEEYFENDNVDNEHRKNKGRSMDSCGAYSTKTIKLSSNISIQDVVFTDDDCKINLMRYKMAGRGRGTSYDHSLAMRKHYAAGGITRKDQEDENRNARSFTHAKDARSTQDAKDRQDVRGESGKAEMTKTDCKDRRSAAGSEPLKKCAVDKEIKSIMKKRKKKSSQFLAAAPNAERKVSFSKKTIRIYVPDEDEESEVRNTARSKNIEAQKKRNKERKQIAWECNRERMIKIEKNDKDRKE